MTAPGFDAAAPFGTYAAPSVVEFGCRLACEGGDPVSRYIGRKIAARYAKNVRRCLDAEVEGLRFRLEPHRNFYDRGMFAKRVLPERAWFDDFYEGAAPDAVVYDIGANVGVFALVAAHRLGPGAQVVAVEPHPVTAAKLAANVAFNGASVAVVPVGVADAPGELTLYVNNDANEGENTFHRPGPAAAGVTVPVTTLVDLIAAQGHDRIDLMKLDVEGFEDRVLCPFFAAAAPDAWPSRILMEHVHHHMWREDVVARLRSLGYVAVRRDHENTFFKRNIGS